MCFLLQPLLFESIVIDQLQHLKEVVTSQRSEENEDVSIVIYSSDVTAVVLNIN